MTRIEPNRHLRATPWIWLFPVVSILLTAAALWMYQQNARVIPARNLHPDYTIDTLQLVIGLTYPWMGAFIVQRSLGNKIGWLFCIMGLFSALYQFSISYGSFAYFTLERSLPLADVVTWIQNWAWFVPINLFVLTILLYPTGQPPSRRWYPLLWGLLAMSPILFLETLILLWPLRGPVLLLPVDELSPEMYQAQQALMRSVGYPVIITLTLLMLPLAVVSLVQRLRRSGEIEQQQVKWFLYAGIVFGFTLVVDIAIAITMPQLTIAQNILWSGILPVMAVGLLFAVGFAILRYRLFDIDLIIRRTLLYSAITGVLVIIYVASVILLQTILRSVTGQTSPVAVVISTLLIAALFNPLRLRFQAVIDRRFYRTRFSTDQALHNLATVIQSEVDLDRLSAALVATTDEAFHPEAVSLWLRSQRTDRT